MPPPVLTPAVWQAVALVAICLLLGDATRVRRLQRFTNSSGRLSAYRSAIVCLWVSALPLMLAGADDLAWMPVDGIGWIAGGAAAVGYSVLLAYFILALTPPLHCVLRPAARQKYAAALRGMQYMLPVSPAERNWWIVLSISAGVCEEIIFRGLLPLFLQGLSHGSWNLNPAAAWLFASLIFGCCHHYQGTGGVIRTFVAGLMFSLLAILSGSLLLPILLHIVVDLAVLCMYQPRLDNPAAAAQLITGCYSEQGLG